MTLDERSNGGHSDIQVSTGDPCPFLRALVSDGYLNDGTVPIGELRRTVVDATAAPIIGPAISLIALTGNGFQPGRVIHNVRRGVELDELRGGPADKRGGGTRILDQYGHVNEAELERLSDFASEKNLPDGATELGLSMSELNTMMHANSDRSRQRRRPIDRLMMMGEWPVLLVAMSKRSTTGQRYLAVDEVRTLFVERRLPSRVLDRLTRSPGDGPRAHGGE